MSVSVFEYYNSISFMRDYFSAAQRRNPAFSIRAWAKKMGMKNHNQLVYFLNRKRPLRPQHLEFVLKGIEFSEMEFTYFTNMVHLDVAKTETEKIFYLQQLKNLHPRGELAFVELNHFKVVSDWYHMAILEMTDLKGFKNSPRWISEKLNKQIAPTQAEEGVKRLLEVGLLEEKDGQLQKVHRALTTPLNATTEAIKKYHGQVIDLAKESLATQGLDERYFNSFALSLPKDKMTEAKELVRKFRKEIGKLSEAQAGDEVVQVNLQMFKVTSNEVES